MQYVLIINVGEDYRFKNFLAPNEVIAYVTNMSAGPNKVHKIISLDKDLNVVEKTIGFIDGQLSLIDAQ